MNIEKTKEFAKRVRKETIKIIYEAQASHVGGSLSMVDILSVLYRHILKFDINNLSDKKRDRFILSKGHSCSSLYVTLALSGFFPLSNLKRFGQNGSIYLSHASHKVRGIEFSTGSLGHALPVGCGMALAAKRKKMKNRVFVLLSDGELDEGSNWEAMLFAPQYKLDNLVVIIDYNKIQSLGRVEEVIDLYPLKDKINTFNWCVKEIDGHNFNEIYETFSSLPFTTNKPSLVIANTIKGKGVSFMEDKLLWHYKSPSKEQFDKALEQIEND